MDGSGAWVRTALRIQGGLLLAGAVAFGALLPLLGAAIWATGTAPPGEDPAGIGIVLGVAGPLTALFYLPGGVVSLLAAGRHRPGQLGWVVAATIAAVPVCSLFGGLPLLLAILEQRR